MERIGLVEAVPRMWFEGVLPRVSEAPVRLCGEGGVTQVVGTGFPVLVSAVRGGADFSAGEARSAPLRRRESRSQGWT